MKNVHWVSHIVLNYNSISRLMSHTSRTFSQIHKASHEGRRLWCMSWNLHAWICSQAMQSSCYSSEVNTIQMPRGAARSTEPTDTASELTTVPRPLWFLGWLAIPVPLQCICPTMNSHVDSRYKLCQAPTHLFTTKPKNNIKNQLPSDGHRNFGWEKFTL